MALYLVMEVWPAPRSEKGHAKGFMALLRWIVASGLALVIIVVLFSRWEFVYERFQRIRHLGFREALIAAIDIAVVSYVVYRFFIIIRGTRAVQLLKGIVALLVATSVSQWLGLVTVNWLLRNVRTMLFVALPVVFQPELRRALEQIGRGGLFNRPLLMMFEHEDPSAVVDEIAEAAEVMSRNKIGALIVLERETGLQDFIETGIRLEALVTSEILVNIFIPNTPLHDGAVIVRGNRIMAAACFLPLTDALDLDREMGGRHRAALGITEHSDALALVISEETGAISMASGGKLIRNLDPKGFKEIALPLLKPKGTVASPGWWRT